MNKSMLGLGLAVVLPVSGLFAMAASPVDDNTDANIVDEVIWGSADELLKAIDNQFCRKKDGTYDYSKRNRGRGERSISGEV